MHNTLLINEERPQDFTPAVAPYPRSGQGPAKLLREYKIIMSTYLASYRADWFFHTFASLILPISLVLFAGAIRGGETKDDAIFMLGGNMAMSVAFGPTIFLISKMGWARQNKEFEYWIALPVHKIMLVLAIISVATLFALPGLIGTYVLGTLFLHLSFMGGWLLLLLVPLSILPMAGLGAVIGNFMPNGQVAGIVGNLFITFVGFLSPLLIRPEHFIVPIRVISWFMPTTYIAEAFRAALGAQISTSLPLDLVFLVVSAVIFLALAQWKIDWRTV